jgi:hypothetical protein
MDDRIALDKESVWDFFYQKSTAKNGTPTKVKVISADPKDGCIKVSRIINDHVVFYGYQSGSASDARRFVLLSNELSTKDIGGPLLTVLKRYNLVSGFTAYDAQFYDVVYTFEISPEQIIGMENEGITVIPITGTTARERARNLQIELERQ